MHSDLFKSHEPVLYQLEQASILEFPSFYSVAEATRLFDLLQLEIPWSQAEIRIAGRLIPIPRLQCWIGDVNSNYAYSGITLQPQPWSQTLRDIKANVEKVSGNRFNSVLANYYRDGNDSVAWHSDNEPELGLNPVVASVSFGASRLFELKHKNRSDLDKVRLLLHHGTLIVMKDEIQHNWLHQIPKDRSLKEPRINLTFRHIVS